MNKVKILVIGKNGNLATAIRDCSITSDAYNNFDITFIGSDEINLLNPESVQDALSVYYADVIINTAAYNLVDDAEYIVNVQKAFDINFHSVEQIADYCNKINALFVHFSTDYVFFGDKPSPRIETDLAMPHGHYGMTKLFGEGAAHDANKHLIIRLSWLYYHKCNNFFTKLLTKFKSEQEISIIDDKFSTPSYALDVANLLPKIILETLNSPWHHGKYHFSSREVMSRYEFAQHIYNAASELFDFKPIKINPIKSSSLNEAAMRPNYSALCSDKIEKSFNIQIPSAIDSIKLCSQLHN
jgi:dTDP-4-dehydrorhamnose reductase